MVTRQHFRFPAVLSGKLVSGDQPYPITLSDVSKKGCRIRNTVAVVPGQRVDLFLYAPGETAPLFILGAMIRWVNHHGIGIEFEGVPWHYQSRLDGLLAHLETRRQWPRFPATLSGKMVSGDQLYAIKFGDVSRKGCRITNRIALQPGKQVDLFLYPPGEATPLFFLGAVIRWSNTHGIGVEFQYLPWRFDRLVDQYDVTNN